MKLKFRILSGILAGSIFIPCIGVKAADECSVEVAKIMHKINTRVGVMSYSIESAWSAYEDLIRGYCEYFLDKKRSKQIYNVLLKLEQNVLRMPITDSNLTHAIYALYSCYTALYEEKSTNYNAAHDKWEETRKMYSSLSLEMKDTRYAPMFNFMIAHCTSRMRSCAKREFAARNYYEEFFEDIVNKLKTICEKPPEERSETKIDSLENIAIYELLEPLRFWINYRNYRGHLSVYEFMESIKQCSRQIERHARIFIYMNGKFPGFGNKLREKACEYIAKGDTFKDNSDYPRAMESYYMAKIFLRLCKNVNTSMDYTHVNSCISFCRKRMIALGENVYFNKYEQF